MKDRVKKAARIVEVQKQLQRMENWKMAALDRRLAELESDQEGLIRSLNDDQALHGLFIDSTARRLRASAEEAQRTAGEKEAQAARLVEQGTRVKSAERRSEAVEAEADRTSTGKELHDIAERHVARRTTSLP